MARANNKKAVRPDGKMAKRCVSEEALRDAIATTQRRYRRNINVLALVGAVAAFAALRLPTPTEPETFDADASLRTRAEPGEFGWVEADASHVRESIAAVDASAFDPSDVVDAIVERRAKPLLLRGAMKAWSQAAAWMKRDTFLERHGDVVVGVGVGSRMDSTHNWVFGAAPPTKEPPGAAALRARFRAQVERGEEPSLPLGDFARHIRDGGGLPRDAYVFAAVDDAPVASDVPQVMAIWERLATPGAPLAEPGRIIDGTLLGLGGNGTGVLFHEHQFTVTGVFAGRKRWFIYDARRARESWIGDCFRAARRADPAFDLDSVATFARAMYPLAVFQEEWARVGFECVQGPGDLLYIPKGFSHATLNFGETLSIALQGAHLDPPR